MRKIKLLKIHTNRTYGDNLPKDNLINKESEWIEVTDEEYYTLTNSKIRAEMLKVIDENNNFYYDLVLFEDLNKEEVKDIFSSDEVKRALKHAKRAEEEKVKKASRYAETQKIAKEKAKKQKEEKAKVAEGKKIEAARKLLISVGQL